MKLSKLLVTTALVTALTACSSTKPTDPYQGDEAQYIYATGHTYLQKEDYSAAITAYQSLNSQYPFDEYAKKGDLDLIYAQYKNDEPALTLAAANRFIRMYPTDPGVAYAYYMRGVINFDNGRSFLQRYFPYDMAKHNPIEYQNAYQDFAMVATQYPHSPYAPDAKRRMVYLNNTMAEYQLNVATYYYQMKAYVAAANRAKVVLLHYPTAPALEGSLVIMAESYQQLNLPVLQKSAELLLKANFPNNALVKELPMPTLASVAEAQQQVTQAAFVGTAPNSTLPPSTGPAPQPAISVTAKPLKSPTESPTRTTP